MQRLSRYYYSGTLVVIGVLLFIMFDLHPYLCDDWRFRMPMSEFLSEPSLHSFFDGWDSSVKSCFYEDNGRIPQLLASVMVVMPRWIMAILLSASVCVCIFLSAKIAGIWMRHPISFGILVLVWVFAMPWPDYMFGIMFAANYLPPAALMLSILWLLIRSKLRVWSAVVLGLLVGCSHELYCAAMIVVTLAFIAFDNGLRGKVAYVLLASLFVSMAYLYCVPGTAVRASSKSLLEGLANPFAYAYIGVLFYVYLIIAAVALSIKSWRRGIDMRILLLCISGASAGWLVWRVFLGGQRLVWCLDIFSAIGIVALLSVIPLKRVPMNSALAVGVSMIVICFAHLSMCIPWFGRMHREVECVRLMAATDRSALFYNLTTPDDAPWFLFGKPNFNIYNSEWHDLDFVVPVALKEFRPKLCINSVGRPVYLYDGLMVLPSSGINTRSAVMNISYGEFTNESACSLRPFTGADGKEYLYVCPYYRPLRTKGRRMISAEVVE